VRPYTNAPAYRGIVEYPEGSTVHQGGEHELARTATRIQSARPPDFFPGEVPHDLQRRARSAKGLEEQTNRPHQVGGGDKVTPRGRRGVMPTFEEYRGRSVAERLRRLERTPSELETAVAGKSDDVLGRRPAAKSWSAKEILCHLRDVEELFQTRFHTIVATDEPRILVLGATASDLSPWRIGGPIGHPLDPDRWAEDRQYLRNDSRNALTAFQRRRAEVSTLLRSLSPVDWERVGIHLSRGRLTLADWVASLAAHDDNHLDQISRALEGRP
jgi:DinB superfamily